MVFLQIKSVKKIKPLEIIGENVDVKLHQAVLTQYYKQVNLFTK